MEGLLELTFYFKELLYMFIRKYKILYIYIFLNNIKKYLF